MPNRNESAGLGSALSRKITGMSRDPEARVLSDGGETRATNTGFPAFFLRYAGEYSGSFPGFHLIPQPMLGS